MLAYKPFFFTERYDFIITFIINKYPLNKYHCYIAASVTHHHWDHLEIQISHM